MSLGCHPGGVQPDQLGGDLLDRLELPLVLAQSEPPSRDSVGASAIRTKPEKATRPAPYCYHDVEGHAQNALKILRDGAGYARLGANARRTVEDKSAEPDPPRFDAAPGAGGWKASLATTNG